MNTDTPALSAMMLADELTRCASVAARHLSYAESGVDGEHHANAAHWRASAERHELRFLALVDEARRRLVAGDTELERSLAIYTWGPSLVAEPPQDLTTVAGRRAARDRGELVCSLCVELGLDHDGGHLPPH